MSFLLTHEYKPFKKLAITNRLQLFTNYINNPQNIDIDWEMIGFQKNQAEFSIPGIQNYQKAESLIPGKSVSIEAGDVKFIVISKK